MQLPTVKIKGPFDGGYCLINEADFDASVHQLFEEPKAAKQPEPAADSDSDGTDNEPKTRGRK